MTAQAPPFSCIMKRPAERSTVKNTHKPAKPSTSTRSSTGNQTHQTHADYGADAPKLYRRFIPRRQELGPVNIHCTDAFQREGERLVAARALRQPDASAFEAHQPDSLVFLFMCRQHWRGNSQWQLQCTPLERVEFREFDEQRCGLGHKTWRTRPCGGPKRTALATASVRMLRLFASSLPVY